MNNSTPTQIRSSVNRDALEARFALRVTSALTEQSSGLPQDLSERLRIAREQALERARAARKVAQPAAAPSVVAQGSSLALGRGGDESGRWIPWASVLPLIALVGGLLLIQQWHANKQIAAAAEIDASLLADDVPPDAYADPGFLEFLKAPRD